MNAKAGVCLVVSSFFGANFAQAQFNLDGLKRDLGKITKQVEQVMGNPAPKPAQTNTVAPQEDKCLNGNDVRNAALTGAGVGGVAGGLLGGKKDALTGVILGGLAGAAVGHAASEQRKKYCSESDFLDGEIAATQVTLSEREKKVRAAEQQLVVAKSDISRLEKERAWNEATRRKAEQQAGSIETSIKANDAELAKYKNEIGYLENVISTSQPADPRNAAEVAALDKRKKELSDKKQDLSRTHARLLNVNDGLNVEKDRVHALLKSRTAAQS
jgi:hypothetical protein